jgi:hypothetical protein
MGEIMSANVSQEAASLTKVFFPVIFLSVFRQMPVYHLQLGYYLLVPHPY